MRRQPIHRATQQLPQLALHRLLFRVIRHHGWNAHAPADVCVDDFQANRSPGLAYRTAPLAGLFSHQKGGFYHDGRFATLLDVVNHYDSCKGLGLSDGEKADLVQYLLTL